MIKFISKTAPNDRRALQLDPATVTTIGIKPGMVLKEGVGPSFYRAKATDVALVPGPVFAFTDSSRRDVQAAKSLTVVDGPFVADIDADAYVTPAPAQGDALVPGADGTPAEHGKLKTLVVATVANLGAVVAYCTRGVDADGFIRIKVQR
jgi:hypothetical protein